MLADESTLRRYMPYLPTELRVELTLVDRNELPSSASETFAIEVVAAVPGGDGRLSKAGVLRGVRYPEGFDIEEHPFEWELVRLRSSVLRAGWVAFDRDRSLEDDAMMTVAQHLGRDAFGASMAFYWWTETVPGAGPLLATLADWVPIYLPLDAEVSLLYGRLDPEDLAGPVEASLVEPWLKTGHALLGETNWLDMSLRFEEDEEEPPRKRKRRKKR